MGLNEGVIGLLDGITILETEGRQSRKRYEKMLALDFRFMEFFRVDELSLSRCLANLLDINGSHGQRDLFISRFASMLDISNEFDCSDSKVFLEYSISDIGRIDILIKTRSHYIGIENKPWANDQHEQLLRYSSWLSNEADRNGRKWFFIYLCNSDINDYTLPDNVNEKIRRNIKSISFYQIVAWLRECSNNILAIQVKVFVDSLAQYIHENVNFEVDMSEQSEVVRFALSSPEKTRAAFLISQSIRDIKYHLWLNFIQVLKEKLTNAGIDFSSLDKNDALLNCDKDGGFWIVFRQGARFGLYWMFDGKNNQRLYCGVSSIDGDINDKQLHLKIRQAVELASSISSRESNNSGWPWWNWIDEVEPKINKYWGDNPECWEKLTSDNDGSFSKCVVDFVLRLKQHGFDFDLLT